MKPTFKALATFTTIAFLAACGHPGQVERKPSGQQRNSGDPLRCRPIGCYEATAGLANRYREDR